MEPIIRLDQVTKRFGRHTALDQVSLTVEPGTIFALLGENGAGKTTALRLLLGLIEPTAGTIQVVGLNPLEKGLEVRRRVGYLPEQPSLYDWMTVGEIGRFTAAFYAHVPFLENFRRLTDELKLPWGAQIKTLSKGMRAKVALTLALAQDPELLVLDEPTSGLDLLVRREILERMVDLAARGRTVLLSSHQINEVERIADTVAILHHGRLVAVSPLEELKQETQELTITMNGSADAPPPIAGELLRHRQRGRQWQILVRNCPPQELERWRAETSIIAMESRRPRLEEIVASYLQTETLANGAVVTEEPKP
jgi:ABC-2 type transport system ATP-binding protein